MLETNSGGVRLLYIPTKQRRFFKANKENQGYVNFSEFQEEKG